MPLHIDIDQFISEHDLPAEYSKSVNEHFLTLSEKLITFCHNRRPVFIGMNGAQGTGKSTLALLLQQVITTHTHWNVVVMSLDDFYLTRQERHDLAASVHPLFATRGVPGTHDIKLLMSIIAELKVLADGGELEIPGFDKARDDRMNRESWQVVTGPVDVIILEGWCVGTPPQAEQDIDTAINTFEAENDPDARWRKSVNKYLSGDYAGLFSLLEYVIFLKTPDFESVYKWRLLQEQKLARTSTHPQKIMNESEIQKFIQHYERLTRWNLDALPGIADVSLELNTRHHCVRSTYA